ncbi:MAG TPA: SGNH/GDSL hydrolase family protein [Baekduia sp.]
MGRKSLVGLVVALCAALAGPISVSSASTHRPHSAKARKAERAKLLRAVKKDPKVINRRSFVKRASLVNFRLPITVRLRGSTTSTNPNRANIDLGASLGQRTLGLGGDLSGELVFHDSYDGGALGNVDLTLTPGPKALTTTSIPLLWNTDVTNPTTSIAPTFNLAAGVGGCGNFAGNSPVTVAGQQTVPYWSTQSVFDAAGAPSGYVPDTPGIDDPARLVASAAVGSSENLGPSSTPFPYSSQSTPGAFTQPPSVGDSVLRTAPLSLKIATPGTEVQQTDASNNGVQGSQNIVIGKSGGQANLFGNIPGKAYGIDVTLSLATRLTSILRAVDPDYVPLIGDKPWPTTWSACRQAYTGAVQNYIPGVRLQGNLKISPGITSDGALRIAKATLATQQPAQIALAACLYPYSLYTAESNSSDTVGQTVNSWAAGGRLPTNEFVARAAPTSVDCGSTPTKLVQDAPTLDIAAAQAADGYTTTVDGKRVSVAGELNVTQVSADILIGDKDAPAPSHPSAASYLALGDSMAYGYQAAKFNSQLPTPNPASFNTGYVDVFAQHMQQANPGLVVVNDGCPGETTGSLVSGFNPAGGLCGRGSGFPYPWLHHPYAAGQSQLQNAVSYLSTHSTTTSPITLNIGANDLLVFLSGCGFGTAGYSASCVASGMNGVQNTIVGNTRTILDQLQAVTPASASNYVVMGLYNPYPTLLNVAGSSGDAVIAGLNAKIKAVAEEHGAHFVNPLPIFNPAGAAGGSETGDVPTVCALTLMCPGGTYNPATGDIHPSDKGYAALASLFESASGL